MWNIIYLNCGESCTDISDHCSYIHILINWSLKKHSASNGIWIYMHVCTQCCSQLSLPIKPTNQEMDSFWVCNMPIDEESRGNEWMISYIAFTSLWLFYVAVYTMWLRHVQAILKACFWKILLTKLNTKLFSLTTTVSYFEQKYEEEIAEMEKMKGMDVKFVHPEVNDWHTVFTLPLWYFYSS